MVKKGKNQHDIDTKAIIDHRGVGADNPGGQDHISPQRAINVGVQDGANMMPKKTHFKGIRIHDDGPDSWGVGQGLK